jgi:hypothetical protein
MEVTDLGLIKFFLRIEISRNKKEKSITLSQKKYTQKLLDKFALNVKKTLNLCQMKYRLEPNPDKVISEDIHQYQQQIKSLMYLMTVTKPDLAYSVSLLTRFMSNPSFIHQKALHRI